jgi:predicted PurR-regulated permease PerM
MARIKSLLSTTAKSPLSTTTARQVRHEVQRWQAGVTIPRSLAYMTLVALAVLFLWLTINVDLVIFAGVLFGICLRRAAEGLSRLVRVPVGWSLAVVVVLIIAFFAGFGWTAAKPLRRVSRNRQDSASTIADPPIAGR